MYSREKAVVQQSPDQSVPRWVQALQGCAGNLVSVRLA